MPNQGKLSSKYLVLCFVKSIPWLFNRNLLTEIKYLFYRNIAILCAKCLVWLGPKRLIPFIYLRWANERKKDFPIREELEKLELISSTNWCLTPVVMNRGMVSISPTFSWSFYAHRSLNCKKYSQAISLFCTFVIFARNSCV